MDCGRRGWGGRRGDEGWRGGGDWLLLSSIQWVAPLPSADVLGWLLLPVLDGIEIEQVQDGVG